MKNDKFLIGIVIGIVVLVIVSLTVVLLMASAAATWRVLRPASASS